MNMSIKHHPDTVKQHHVVVFDNDDMSAAQFLNRQGLADRIGHDFDSREEFGADAYWKNRVTNGQVAGNVHYHHFAKATIPVNLNDPIPTQQTGNTDLRYWLTQLRDSLKAGEKVDALVFTGNHATYDRFQVTQFIAQVKELCPGIQVVLVNPELDWIKRQGPQLAYADGDKRPSPHGVRVPLVVKPGREGFTLNPAIDAVLDSMDYKTAGMLVRDFIGAEPSMAYASSHSRLR